MARAGIMQAETVRKNIVALIKGKELVKYTPLALEGALKLSLGKVRDRLSDTNSRSRTLMSLFF
jgi:hypothetical protein